MKCRYNQCKYGGEVPREEAIKVGKYYYHKECYKEKELKKQIEGTYYNKFQNKESVPLVRKAINQYVDNYEPEYVLYVLNQNIKLNSIFGLGYYLNDKKFKEKYIRLKASLIKFNVDEAEIENSMNFKFRRKERRLWGDLLCR